MIAIDVLEIVNTAFVIFFMGLCAGLFFGILNRAISAIAGIIKHLFN